MSEDCHTQFPTTHWTLVARLRCADRSVALRALDDLMSQYRYTLYAYIRRRGFPHHDAEDALQEFLQKLVNVRALEALDSNRGRLRGFLCTALGRFLSNWRRDEARRGAITQDMNEDAPAGDEARYARERFTDGDTPQRVFERKWGHALMSRVMERLNAQCEELGKGAFFYALRPVLLSGGSLRGHNSAAIAERLGISEGALRVALSRHLRQYRKVLEEEVSQTVENPGEVADEIAYLMAVFDPVRNNGNGMPRKCSGSGNAE